MAGRVEISKPSGDTTGLTGAFISHAGHDPAFAHITRHFAENGIGYIGDSQIALGEDFHQSLRSMLQRASSGVVLVAKDAFRSPWVHYEIGMLEGMGTNVILYCDSKDPSLREMIPEYLRGHEVVDNLDALSELVSASSVFGSLFKHETPEISRGRFAAALAGKCEYALLTLTLPNLASIGPKTGNFGCIVVRLARSGEWTSEEYVEPNECPATHDPREGTICAAAGKPDLHCPVVTDALCADEVETVALNSILYSKNREKERVEFVLPIHAHFGMTFKCFVDVIDSSERVPLERVLRNSGMLDIGYSESGETRRLYFLLPEAPESGLHWVRSPEGILNNFICPGGCLY